MKFQPFDSSTAPETRLRLLNAYREHVDAVGKLASPHAPSIDEAIIVANSAALLVAIQQFVTFAAIHCVDDNVSIEVVSEEMRKAIASIADRILDRAQLRSLLDGVAHAVAMKRTGVQ